MNPNLLFIILSSYGQWMILLSFLYFLIESYSLFGYILHYQTAFWVVNNYGFLWPPNQFICSHMNEAIHMLSLECMYTPLMGWRGIPKLFNFCSLWGNFSFLLGKYLVGKSYLVVQGFLLMWFLGELFLVGIF